MHYCCFRETYLDPVSMTVRAYAILHVIRTQLVPSHTPVTTAAVQSTTTEVFSEAGPPSLSQAQTHPTQNVYKLRNSQLWTKKK